MIPLGTARTAAHKSQVITPRYTSTTHRWPTNTAWWSTATNIISKPSRIILSTNLVSPRNASWIMQTITNYPKIHGKPPLGFASHLEGLIPSHQITCECAAFLIATTLSTHKRKHQNHLLHLLAAQHLNLSPWRTTASQLGNQNLMQPVSQPCYPLLVSYSASFRLPIWGTGCPQWDKTLQINSEILGHVASSEFSYSPIFWIGKHFQQFVPHIKKRRSTLVNFRFRFTQRFSLNKMRFIF